MECSITAVQVRLLGTNCGTLSQYTNYRLNSLNERLVNALDYARWINVFGESSIISICNWLSYIKPQCTQTHYFTVNSVSICG